MEMDGGLDDESIHESIHLVCELQVKSFNLYYRIEMCLFKIEIKFQNMEFYITKITIIKISICQKNVQ